MDTNTKFEAAPKSSINRNIITDASAKVQNEGSSTTINVNDISLQFLGDPKVPMIIFYGPPNCGKTVGLLRLLRYLKNDVGLKVEVIKTLRKDHNYVHVICPNFQKSLDDTESSIPIPNQADNFIAVAVSGEQGAICTFMELPGEFLYDPAVSAHTTPPPYLDQIKAHESRKIVFFMVPLPTASSMELDSQNLDIYCKYIVENISKLFDVQNDSFAFIIPKADSYDDLLESRDQPKSGAAYTKLTQLNSFKPIIKYFKSFNLPILVLPLVGGRASGKFILWSNPIWPNRLWAEVSKLIGGQRSNSAPGLLRRLFS
jgi:hypothetical protein